MQPLGEAGRLVQSLTGRMATDVAGVAVRELKNVERGTGLGAGVAVAGVESSGAIVDERY